MTKWAIKDVGEMVFYKIIKETIEHNVPSSIKVTKQEYDKFIEENQEYIGESYSIYLEVFIVEDIYGNKIASIHQYEERDYYINPELLQLGIDKKCKIEDKVKIIGEEECFRFVPKPANINIEG